MPYDLSFSGSFFDIADFMAGLDRLVQMHGEATVVDGRLVTVDGFNISPDPEHPETLIAKLHVTTFVAPADQGLTGGAAPTTPEPAATPAAPAAPSSGTPAPPTATVTP
jgi:hypothetical protein